MLLQSVSYCEDLLINFILHPACNCFLVMEYAELKKKILTTILVFAFQPAAS